MLLVTNEECRKYRDTAPSVRNKPNKNKQTIYINNKCKLCIYHEYNKEHTVFYLPTDAQESCFKRILKFTLKQLLHISV